MTIKIMFVLMLFLNGNVIEFMGHHENEKGEWVEMGVPGCLAMKRTLSRNGWKDNDPFAPAFKFTPPTGAASCGCGSSFTL